MIPKALRRFGDFYSQIYDLNIKVKLANRFAICLLKIQTQMSDDIELTRKRFIDLSKKSYEKGIYTYTGFLTLQEQSELADSEKLLYPSDYSLNGGYEAAERCMAGFGSERTLGYEQAFPIVCVKVCPLAPKFAEKLSHRDFLGSIMNLGIERSEFGDIILKESEAYVFCSSRSAPILCSELSRVRHTSVLTVPVEDPASMPQREYDTLMLQVSSERADGIIARLYKLSRSQSAALFCQKNIYLMGRLMENESRTLKEGDIVSVRGYGKFVYEGIRGHTKKGNLSIQIKIYK